MVTDGSTDHGSRRTLLSFLPIWEEHRAAGCRRPCIREPSGIVVDGFTSTLASVTAPRDKGPTRTARLLYEEESRRTVANRLAWRGQHFDPEDIAMTPGASAGDRCRPRRPRRGR